MKHEFTYGQLIAIDQDIAQQRQNSPAFDLFNSEKIKRFYQLYEHRIALAKGHLRKLIIKHVTTDERGEPRFINKADGSKEYIWKTASSFKDYEEERQSFLNLTVDVFI